MRRLYRYAIAAGIVSAGLGGYIGYKFAPEEKDPKQYILPSAIAVTAAVLTPFRIVDIARDRREAREYDRRVREYLSRDD